MNDRACTGSYADPSGGPLEFVQQSPYITEYISFVDSAGKVGAVRIIHLLCVIAIAASQVSAQSTKALPTDTLATIGTSVITAKDFLERYELMPWPGKDRAAERDSAKIKALRSLVAERLLAQEAAARGLGTDSTTQRQINGLERLMVRDALYRHEVLGRIQISDRDLSEGMKRYPREVRVLFLHAPSEDAARSMRSLVRKPGVVDSLLQTLSPELMPRVDSMTVTFGIIDRVLEDTVYALSANRRLSGVFRSDTFGWGVVAWLDSWPFADAQKKSIPDRIHQVENIVRARKQTERAGKYMGSILSPQRADADPVLFERFATAFHTVMTTDTASRATRTGYRFANDDLDHVERILGADVFKPLVRVASGPFSVREVIDALKSREFQFTSLDTAQFRNRLNMMIKDAVGSELISREGYRQHMQNAEVVQHDVRLWADYWTAGAMKRALVDSVTVQDEEVVTYLVSHAKALGNMYAVNVREVLSDSLRTALTVLERTLGGEPLSTLTARTTRKAWAARGGESGFFRVDSIPELGVRALVMDAGRVGGPLRLAEGYSVFEVLGKRRIADSTAKFPPADSLMIQGRKMLRAERQFQAVTNSVSDMARRTGTRIYEDRLRALKVNDANMVTRRYIGFGGVITAVPTISPMWEWKDPEQPKAIP